MIPRLPLLLLSLASAAPGQEPSFSRLPDLPDAEGFAGMFAGVSAGALVVAGGANFPGRRPWEGGAKVWHDPVWALAEPGAAWKKVGRLPRPLAYGISATFGDEILCVGGSDAGGHRAECFALRLAGETLVQRPLPSLPRPCANACGTIIDATLFVAGGILTPDASRALHTFWSLDLRTPGARWVEREPWPGRERMLAVAASADGAFILMSGAALRPGPDGKAQREWLRDAYRYAPGPGWERLPDLPRAAVAAPSPAPSGRHGILILSGDDGSRVGFKPESQHPGFPRDIWMLDPGRRTWSAAGACPFSRATVPTAFWRNGWVVPSGEARPGFRSNEVWRINLP